MEKLDKSISKEYGPLIMWASDMNELLSELKDCTDIEFVADDVKFETVDEFVKESKGRNPSIVKIKARNPYINIDLYPPWSRLYVSSSQLLASGLFFKIDSILSRCERKPRLIYRLSFMFFSMALIMVILEPYFFKPHITLWVSALIFAWAIYIGALNVLRHSLILPIHREEKRSFFHRNIDGIIIAIISALLGAVGGAVATKVADRVWPNSPSTSIEKGDAQPAKTLIPVPVSGTSATE